MSAPLWPVKDYTRVPYALYHDPQIYRGEQDRIFRGRTWSFLCLEAEIAAAGDFKTTWVGDTPVIVQRTKDGQCHAYVNRCAHRGALVRRETRGNAPNHVCIYHRWCYDLKGKLVGIPFQRGVRGEGGLDKAFNKDMHSLQPLTVATYGGVVFGTFSSETEPLVDYLGPQLRSYLDTLFKSPIEIIGYQRQIIDGNWKQYAENLRDTYHASLLHEFLVTFGIDRATQKGGVAMDARHRHNLTYAESASDSQAEASRAYQAHDLHSNRLKLEAPEILAYYPEFSDQRSVATFSMFPNAAFQRLNNSVAVRQIQPKGVGQFVLAWTYFGYSDDTPELRAHRLRQMNLLGPAGFVSMEDTEAIEIVQRATAPDADRHAVVEMGGAGEISDQPYRVTDVPLRGFWSFYSELMGIEPEGAVR